MADSSNVSNLNFSRLTLHVAFLSGLILCRPGLATPSPERFGLLSRAETGGGSAQLEACALADSPSANASVQLASWVECSLNGFFPYPANGQWDLIFAATFSEALKATFNDTHYDYDGWLQLYHNFNVTIGQNFAPFQHGVLNTVAVPNANGDQGGFVYVLGWEGGFQTQLKRDLYFTDALFAVVKDCDGRRKITEFRESSNIPNTAPLPPPKNWTCTFG
ncbi:hypothetical protein K491DRAFT_723100 [Lophiostoma macrostomum CBS 122681]|uniref:Uncharacterized protein n=1 Tax=Lophiostoma macrostomum CBS 122681 TaxID=1314788 RepID=A0A6A6SMH7_9PLEO|nr:hypothetical protein K491DRAFT_723100 [Lophiostoma macrostomum CBS 122681]